jgi:copper chaperone NosL
MKYIYIFLAMACLTACSNEPQEINYSKDVCDFCKMTIMDKQFATQCISAKGKVYKFDDVFCLNKFLKNGGVWKTEIEGIYFTDYAQKHGWIKTDKVLFLKSDSLRSPMGGNIAAFNSKEDRENTNKRLNGELLSWDDIKPQ